MLGYNPLLEYVTGRIRRNKNAIIIVNGGTGSGKTYAALDLALCISNKHHTNFKLSTNVDFSFGGLLQKMELPENALPGTVFVLEEVGSFMGGTSSRTWQSKANLFFNSFMQTARCQNQILILTCPVFSNLEKGARQLVHIQISMKSIDYMHKISFGSPFVLQTNAMTGKTYIKRFRYETGGLKIKLSNVAFHLPPPELLTEYEGIKREYLGRLKAEIMLGDVSKVKEAEIKPEPIKSNGKLTGARVLERIKGMREGGFTYRAIADRLGVIPTSLTNFIYKKKKEGLIIT